MASVSLNLPLWRGKYRAAEREAEARYQAAQEEHTDRTNTLIADLKLALFKYQDATRKVTLYRDALIPKARQTLEVTQRAFETGGVDFLNLIRRLVVFHDLHWAPYTGPRSPFSSAHSSQILTP